MIRETPFLLQRTFNFMRTREGFLYMIQRIFSSRVFLFSIIYIISPFDIFPECLLGIFGLLDDLFVVGILLVVLTNFYYCYLVR